MFARLVQEYTALSEMEATPGMTIAGSRPQETKAAVPSVVRAFTGSSALNLSVIGARLSLPAC